MSAHDWIEMPQIRFPSDITSLTREDDAVIVTTETGITRITAADLIEWLWLKELDR